MTTTPLNDDLFLSGEAQTRLAELLLKKYPGLFPDHAKWFVAHLYAAIVDPNIDAKSKQMKQTAMKLFQEVFFNNIELETGKGPGYGIQLEGIKKVATKGLPNVMSGKSHETKV